MKKLLLVLGMVSTIGVANAACYGSSNYYSCYDSNSGNSYSISKYGNTTNVYGSNARTGSNWSSSSRTYGNNTYTYGNSNGRSWNKTDTPYGSYGTDSNGKYFNYRR